MEESLKVLQNNRWLNHAYTLDDKAASELRSKLDNLIDKEIKYRQTLLEKLTNPGLKVNINHSINNLKKFYEYKNSNHNSFMNFYQSQLNLTANFNKSPVNKTLSNLDEKYSNNKYRN